MAKKTKAFKYDDLGKGINTFTRDTMIKENETYVASNVWATGKNSIKKRDGTELLCTIAGVSQIDGMGTYYNGTTKELLAMAGGKLYKVHSGTAVQVGSTTWTSGLRTDFVQAGAKVYISNGTDVMRDYNGTIIADTIGGVIGKNMIYYKNSLWLIGYAADTTELYRSGADNNIGNFTYTDKSDVSGTTTATTASKLVDSAANFTTATIEVGQKVYNSTDSTEAEVTAIDSTTTLSISADIFASGEGYIVLGNIVANSVYVSRNDGQAIKGMFKHQDYLYVVKERSMYRATQLTDEDATIYVALVDPSRGTAAHASIDTVDNDNFMFNETGVYATGYEPNLSDVRTNIVSLRIDKDLQKIQKSRLDDVVAMYFDNHYYLSTTSGGSTYNDITFVYDRQRLGWWKFDRGANCFSEYQNTLGTTYLYMGSPNDGKISYFKKDSLNDDGVGITSKWLSPKYSFDDYVQQKFFHHIVLYMGSVRGQITITVYVDGQLHKIKEQTIGSEGGGGVGTSSIGVPAIGVETSSAGDAAVGETSDLIKIPINKMGRNIQVEITDLIVNKTWELNAIEGMFTEINKMYVKTT